MLEKIFTLKGLTGGSSLPSVEDSVFGNESVTSEYGMSVADPRSCGTLANYNTVGFQFRLTEAICVYGFRYYIYSAKYDHYLRLWDANGNELAAATSKPTTNTSWTEVKLANPVTLKAGETYTVGDYGYGIHTVSSGGATFNNKLKDVIGKIRTNEYGVPTNNNGSWALVDIIFGPASTEKPITEYKIQTGTMNGIAAEVQRISGTTVKMTPEQILSALKSVTK